METTAALEDLGTGEGGFLSLQQRLDIFLLSQALATVPYGLAALLSPSLLIEKNLSPFHGWDTSKQDHNSQTHVSHPFREVKDYMISVMDSLAHTVGYNYGPGKGPDGGGGISLEEDLKALHALGWILIAVGLPSLVLALFVNGRGIKLG